MLGLPVMSFSMQQMLLALALMTMLVPFTASAQQHREFIRYASQLAEDAGVQTFVKPYSTLAAAYVIYSKCAAERALTPADTAYLERKLKEVGTNYIIAYDKAFQARVGAPSSSDLMADYTKTLSEQQEKAATHIAQVIQQNGCANPELQPIIDYVAALRVADAAAPKPDVTAAPKADATLAPAEPKPTAPAEGLPTTPPATSTLHTN